MRDRLIELADCATREYSEYSAEMFQAGNYGIESMGEYVADYLLKNGVIVSPVKVGDKLYIVDKFTGQIVDLTVECISIVKGDIYWHCGDHITVYGQQQLGKTVFLTKEEAEQALKGGEQE